MNNSYGGQVKWGPEFVACFSMEKAEAEELWQENGEDAMSGDNDEGESCNIAPATLNPDFNKAFDGTDWWLPLLWLIYDNCPRANVYNATGFMKGISLQ